MHIRLSSIVAAAGLLASGAALTPADVPSDVPVASLVSSAQSHLARGETSDAIIYYDVAITRDPNNYLTIFKRATAYMSLGRNKQAADDLNRILEIKPHFEGAHLQLARIRTKAGDWNAAKTQYGSANRGPSSPEVVELEAARLAAEMAEKAQRKGHWEECVARAGEAVQVASRSPGLRELRARCRFERGNAEEAMSDLHHLVQLKPGDTKPYVVISATTFYGLGDLDNGITQIRKCIHSDPESKVCKKLHRQEKAVQKALKKIEGQLGRSQTATAGKSLVGTADEPGLLPQVRQQVQDLYSTADIPTRARNTLVERLVEMTCRAYLESNHRDAEKYCEESLEANPESFWGLLQRGKTHLKREEFEPAVQVLSKATEAHPDMSEKAQPILKKAQLALKRSKTKDYYKVLGVAHDADERQIKSAYRKASKLNHPDIVVKQGVAKEVAEKKMAAINEAYEVLSNPELRARFDQGDDPNSNEPQNPFQGNNPFGGGGHPFMFQQGGGGSGFKFHFNGPGFGF